MYSATTIAAYSCNSLQVNNVNVSSYTCGKVGNQIVITNFIKSSTYISNITLIIGNIVNPSIGGTTPLFYASIGNDVSISDSSSTVTLIANSFKSCAATYNNTYGNTTG